MRRRLALAALVPAVVALGGLGTAQAVPNSGTAPANHGQCVSKSAQPSGPGGRSAVAKEKNACGDSRPTLSCTENEDGGNTVIRNSAEDTVTITGSGPGSAGSVPGVCDRHPGRGGPDGELLLHARAGHGPLRRRRTASLRGRRRHDLQHHRRRPAVRRIRSARHGHVHLPATGTVTRVGFVYDRGDTGSVTYSDATVGGVALNL